MYCLVPGNTFLSWQSYRLQQNHHLVVDYHPHLIENNIKTVVLDVINRLVSNTGLDCGLYKVEWLCSLILRLGGMLEEVLLPNLLQVRHLISLMINQNTLDVNNSDRAVKETGN